MNMAKTHMIRFRVSKLQLEQIRNDAHSRGYVALAPYLRDLALLKSPFIETKIVEIEVTVKKLLEVLNG